MAVGDIPIYYESSWSILSTIGLVNLLFGFLVVGITGYSPIALVPITVSTATAIANGLCYYALYQVHSTRAVLAASVFAEVFWLIQEAGLSFYSYMILNRVLSGRPRHVFLTLFWFLIVAIVGIRCSITGSRILNMESGNSRLGTLIGRLHIGYFIAIAAIETLSAFFLLRIFIKARRDSAELASHGSLFRYLAQSTELRLATLALIGISRAITYSSQRSVKASSVTGQIDRFVFTLECMFPAMMYIDILASRIATSAHSRPSISNERIGSLRFQSSSHPGGGVHMYSLNHPKPDSTAREHTFSSQEHFASSEQGAPRTRSLTNSIDSVRDELRNRANMGAISKTIEFEFRESIH